jgi:hypothetical protein
MPAGASTPESAEEAARGGKHLVLTADSKHSFRWLTWKEEGGRKRKKEKTGKERE